jgi:putative transposase
MDQSTHEVRLANWKAVIEQCQTRPKGHTAKQWLDANGISSKKYYYWLRKVRSDVYKQASAALIPSEEEKLPAVSFAEIPAKDVLSLNDPSAVVIKTKKSTIEIPTNIPESLMIKLVKAVSHAL